MAFPNPWFSFVSLSYFGHDFLGVFLKVFFRTTMSLSVTGSTCLFQAGAISSCSCSARMKTFKQERGQQRCCESDSLLDPSPQWLACHAPNSGRRIGELWSHRLDSLIRLRMAQEPAVPYLTQVKLGGERRWLLCSVVSQDEMNRVGPVIGWGITVLYCVRFVCVKR
jgi:hypothetical protein